MTSATGADPQREARSQYRYRFGTAEFDDARCELRVGGQPREVQHRPLEVLALLLRHAGEVVTREELLEAVWGDRPTVPNVVDTAFTKLRAALGEENAALIVTQPRVGYRLVGPVERTVVGRDFASALELTERMPVARRENFQLISRFSQTERTQVWLARHTKTHERRVYKFTADGEGLALLKREATLSRVLRQNLGDRADLIPVLDWNFEAPPFFIESAYGGETLEAWALTHLPGLAVAERLAVFLQVTDCVAAAHSVGVLHKDLKPSNVLVSQTSQGWQIRVIDFGSARLLEPERLHELAITQLGLTVTQGVISDVGGATPLYVAPERIAGGAATVQSDVFALGVLLYQLLAGDLRRPMASSWARDIDDELLREDIAAATDGDPIHRLSSCAVLAERIRGRDLRAADRERERQAEAVALLATEALDRSRARRPWIRVAFSCLCAGLTLSVWFYWQASLARARAERESVRVEAINRFLNEDLLRAGDPTAPGGIADPRLRDILARTAARLQSNLTQAPSIRASIHLTLGRTYTGLGDYDHAEQQLRRSIEAASYLDEDKPLRAQAEYALAQVMLFLSRFPEAQTLLNRADQDAAAQLQRPTPLAVTAHLVRGAYEDDLAHESQALAEFERADHIRQLSAPDDTVLLFETRLCLIDSYIAGRRYADARQAARPLLAQGFSVDRVGIGNWARAREQMAEILSHEQSFSDAIAMDQAVIATLEAGLGKGHYFVAVALSELANVYVDAGQPGLGLNAMKRTYDILKTALGPDSQDTIGARANVAVLESQTGDSQTAVADLTESRDRFAQLLGADNPQVEFFNYYLALSLSDLGRASEAWIIASKLSSTSLANAGEGGEDWEERLQGLKGKILLRQGNKSEALRLLAPAVAKMQADQLPVGLLGPFRALLEEARR